MTSTITRMDTEKDILYSFQASKRAVRELTNAIYRLCSNDEIKRMITRRFNGRMTYFDKENGIFAEILLTQKLPPENDIWVYNIYELDDKDRPISILRSEENNLRGFNLDELACFINVFRRGHEGHGLHLQIRTHSNLDEITA